MCRGSAEVGSDRGTHRGYHRVLGAGRNSGRRSRGRFKPRQGEGARVGPRIYRGAAVVEMQLLKEVGGELFEAQGASLAVLPELN